MFEFEFSINKLNLLKSYKYQTVIDLVYFEYDLFIFYITLGLI